MNRAKEWLMKQWNNLDSTLDSVIQIKIRNNLVADSRLILDRIRGSSHAQTVFCIGNGPSLSEEQVRLASEHPFVATNRAYQLFDTSAFSLGGNGWLMINDFYRSLEVLPALDAGVQQVVVGCHNPSNIYMYKVLMRPSWIFANCAWGLQVNREGVRCLDLSHKQFFSGDFAQKYYAGWSVIFSAIQFAAYLGARQIVLIGCDMDYSGPVQYSGLIKKDRLSIGHICRFEYQEHGRQHMISCRDGLQEMGIEIYNASPSGAIHEIPRITDQELRDLLEQKSRLPRVNA